MVALLVEYPILSLVPFFLALGLAYLIEKLYLKNKKSNLLAKVLFLILVGYYPIRLILDPIEYYSVKNIHLFSSVFLFLIISFIVNRSSFNLIKKNE